MIKMIMKKWLFHHIKEIIFVDSENVGYQIPSKIPQDTLIYIFISDPFIIKKLQNQKISKQILFINISKIRKKYPTKNIMDFCIITKLTEIMTVISRQTKVTICSKDKGYDASIYFLKQGYPQIHLKRFPGPLLYYCGCDFPDLTEILQKADKRLKNQISSHSNMASLKKVLSKRQKDMFEVESYINPIAMVKTYIELDIYTFNYNIYYSGSLMKTTPDKEEALKLYQQYVSLLHEKYDKYQTHERFVRSNELKIRHYIEEAYLKKQSLEECLTGHLGENQGFLTYQLYIGEYYH